MSSFSSRIFLLWVPKNQFIKRSAYSECSVHEIICSSGIFTKHLSICIQVLFYFKCIRIYFHVHLYNYRHYWEFPIIAFRWKLHQRQVIICMYTNIHTLIFQYYYFLWIYINSEYINSQAIPIQDPRNYPSDPQRRRSISSDSSYTRQNSFSPQLKQVYTNSYNNNNNNNTNMNINSANNNINTPNNVPLPSSRTNSFKIAGSLNAKYSINNRNNSHFVSITVYVYVFYIHMYI